MSKDKDIDNELNDKDIASSLDDADLTEDSLSDIQDEKDISDNDLDVQPQQEEAALVEDKSPTELENKDNGVEPKEDLFEFDDPNKMITVRPVKFQQFEMVEPNRSIKRNLDIMQDVSMHISVELGKTKSTIKEVMDLVAGSIVELDKIAGEQVEIYANNKLIAKGEVIVIEDKFGVRVTSTNIPKTIQ